MQSSSATAAVPAAVDGWSPSPSSSSVSSISSLTVCAPRLWLMTRIKCMFEYEPLLCLTVRATHRLAVGCAWGVNLLYCSLELETSRKFLLRTSRRYFRAIIHTSRFFRHWRFGPPFSSPAFLKISDANAKFQTPASVCPSNAVPVNLPPGSIVPRIIVAHPAATRFSINLCELTAGCDKC